MMAIVIDSDEALAEANANVDSNVVVENPTNIQVEYIFTTGIFRTHSKNFLDQVTPVYREKMSRMKRENPEMAKTVYPVYMTENLYEYKGMDKLSAYIAQTAWNILDEQGYAMNQFSTVFTEFWCQEHYKHSAMDQHVHGFGSQIVGFYFTETPENCSRVVFHDPRPSKVQINLPEKDVSIATPASSMINFEPKPGMLMFTNSWLAHAFTRHASNKPIQFIHFNLGVTPAEQQSCPIPAEVV
jgi:uncharacterized protein (TIGR02466 family)